MAAFARWAAAAAVHFRGRHVVWEIYNEPNGDFWRPKPDAAEYTTLALATARAIREAEPSATIIAPAMSGFDWKYMESFLQSGVLEFLDGVSVHPYRAPNQPPETAAADYKRLRELIDRFAPASKRGKIPILSGEWGYASNTKGVSLETQAAFAVRQQLCNLLNGAKRVKGFLARRCGDDKELPGQKQLKQLSQDLGVFDQQYPFHGSF